MNNQSNKTSEKMHVQDHATVFEKPAPKEQQQNQQSQKERKQ